MLLFILSVFYVLINIQIYHVCRSVNIDYIVIVIFVYVLVFFSCWNFPLNRIFDAGVIFPPTTIIKYMFENILIFVITLYSNFKSYRRFTHIFKKLHIH